MKKIWLLISLFAVLCVATSNAAYIDEYPEAYTWAYNNWITTMTSIDKANMNWEITRIALAKMISNYAINVLKKEPDTSKKCQFSDVSVKLNNDYDLWVTKTCQLWLMWQWITKFRPYDNVKRAEFGTILSRLLWWDKYNWWNPYYIKHINQLNIRWIMTNIKNAEKWNEVRGNVMVMLKRSEELKNYKTPTFEELNDDAFQCLFCGPDSCDEYGIECVPGDCYYEWLWKRNFLIPYKDWYIWYDWFPEDMDTIWLAFTYRNLDNPCEAYKTNVTIYYNDNNFYKWVSTLYYWLSDNEIENFSSNSEKKDYTWYHKNIERFFYNIIIWKEENQIISLRLNKFKKYLNNNLNTDWHTFDLYDEFRDCLNKFKDNQNQNFNVDEYMKDFSPEKLKTEIEETENKQKLRSNYCLEYILKN